MSIDNSSENGRGFQAFIFIVNYSWVQPVFRFSSCFLIGFFAVIFFIVQKKRSVFNSSLFNCSDTLSAARGSSISNAQGSCVKKLPVLQHPRPINLGRTGLGAFFHSHHTEWRYSVFFKSKQSKNILGKFPFQENEKGIMICNSERNNAILFTPRDNNKSIILFLFSKSNVFTEDSDMTLTVS